MFYILSIAISLPIVILVLLLVVMIRISYIVITVSDLVTLGRLVGVSMVDLLLEDKVVVQALRVAVVAILVLIMVDPPLSGFESMAFSTSKIELLRSMVSQLDTSIGATSSFAHSGNFARSGNS